MLLVHGAFADGSMWAGVISELQAAGIGVFAVASPLRSLASDAAYVASAVAVQRQQEASSDLDATHQPAPPRPSRRDCA